MNRAELFRKTADFIEQHPRLYSFWETEIPECGTPGCVIGLMGMLHGGFARKNIDVASIQLTGQTSGLFYTKMSKSWEDLGFVGRGQWQHKPEIAVACLRYLADEMEPERNFAAELMQQIQNGPVLIEDKREVAA